MRDLTNLFSLDNICRNPIRLRLYFRIVSYLDKGSEEFSVEELLDRLLRFQNEFLSQDSQLSKLMFKVPLFEIPIKTNIKPDDEDGDDKANNDSEDKNNDGW